MSVDTKSNEVSQTEWLMRSVSFALTRQWKKQARRTPHAGVDEFFLWSVAMVKALIAFGSVLAAIAGAALVWAIRIDRGQTKIKETIENDEKTQSEFDKTTVIRHKKYAEDRREVQTRVIKLESRP